MSCRPSVITLPLAMLGAFVLTPCWSPLASAQAPNEPAIDPPTPERSAVALDAWSYAELYREGRSVMPLLEADLLGVNGEKIGEVEEAVIGDAGKLVALVAESGGVIDIGDTHVAVPWSLVSAEPGERLRIPYGEAAIENLSLLRDQIFTQLDLGEITKVDDEFVTVPTLFKATELLGDGVLLEDGEIHGEVADLIFDADARLQAVVIETDAGPYALPWVELEDDWTPDADEYPLTYGFEQFAELEVFDADRLENDFF